MWDGVGVARHILASAQEGGEWFASPSGCFSPRNHWLGGCWTPQPVWTLYLPVTGDRTPVLWPSISQLSLVPGTFVAGVGVRSIRHAERCVFCENSVLRLKFNDRLYML